jgi:hypothetical protein
LHSGGLSHLRPATIEYFIDGCSQFVFLVSR